MFLSTTLFANPDSLFYPKKRTLKAGPYFGLQSGRFYALEYGWELPKDWEISINGKFEKKLNVYSTWLFGIGISKKIIGRNASSPQKKDWLIDSYGKERN